MTATTAQPEGRTAYAIPDPYLEEVTNATPFPMFRCDEMGQGRNFYDTVVIKGTFDLAPGTLVRANGQSAIAIVDEYWDPQSPERSSTRYAGEVVLVKPSTDVIVTGAATAPGGRPTLGWRATVIVKNRRGLVLNHVAEIVGPRGWVHRRLIGWVLTDPEPTCEVPIRYELAYGGAYQETPNPPSSRGDRWIVHEPNPSGRGFFDERSMDKDASYAAPQWQCPDHPVTLVNREVPLAGFGPIMRPWTCRVKYMGTYDDAWLRQTRIDVENGLPADYAADFDPRYFQCAHPSLITPHYLEGDEEITLANVHRQHGDLTFRLPNLRVATCLRDAGGAWHEQILPLDTVHIDVSEDKVYLCWRLTLDQRRKIHSAYVGLRDHG
jgi:hypothetical protein